jgi:hypothetical protein
MCFLGEPGNPPQGRHDGQPNCGSDGPPAEVWPWSVRAPVPRWAEAPGPGHCALEAHIRSGPTAMLPGHRDGASAVLEATRPHWPKGDFLLADAEYDNLAHTAFRPEHGMLA